MTKAEKEFYVGFAVAVASVAREHGSPSMARDIMVCNGVTMKNLRDADVADFDLEPLMAE